MAKQLKKYIIRVHNPEDLPSLLMELESWGCQAINVYKHIFPGFSIKLTDLLVKWYRNDLRVLSIEESVQIQHFAFQTNAPKHLDRIDQRSFPLSGSFTFSADGTGITAYVIDSGISYLDENTSRGAELSEFGGRVSPVDKIGFPGVPFDPFFDAAAATNPEDPRILNNPRGIDERGHGTAVAGVIGSITYGVAKNITIKTVKVFGRFGEVTFTDDLLDGIDAILEDFNNSGQPPSICNMSLGALLPSASSPETDLEVAVKSMVSAGITVIVAAGNHGVQANRVIPARLPEVITVGAVDSTGIRFSNDRLADFSNFGDVENIISSDDFGFTAISLTNTGSAVDLFAPGVGVRSTYLPVVAPNGQIIEQTAIWSGTSFSSPIVAGIAALVLQNSPLLVPALVKAEIIANATFGVIGGSLNGAPNLLAYSIFVDHNISWTTLAGSLGNFNEGFPVNIILEATGVTGNPVQFSLLSGTFPTGVILNSLTGELTGTAPIVAVDTIFTFTIRATDGVVFADRTFNITINESDLPPVWTTAPNLESIEEGQEFSIQLSAFSNNGIPQAGLVFTAISPLPNTWSISSTGELTGTAQLVVNRDEIINFIVEVDDGLASAERTFIITIKQRFDFLPPSEPEWITPSGNLGIAVENQFFTTFVQAVDGDGLPQNVTYHLQLNVNGSQFGPFGTLPPNFQLNEITGEIFGTIVDLRRPGIVTNFDDNLFSLDGGSTTFDQFSSEIPITVTTFDQNNLILDEGVTTFDIEFSSEGIPFEFAVFVTDGANVASRLFQIIGAKTNPNQLPVWITLPGNLGIFPAEDFVQIQLDANDPDNFPLSLRYNIILGSLPPGMQLDTFSGKISGVPNNVSQRTVFTFVVQLTDGLARVSRTFSITIDKTNNPPEWISPSGLIAQLNEGQFLNLFLSANDPENDRITYKIISGQLPPNTVLEQSTGRIFGTLANVAVNTDFTFTVRADDSLDNSAGTELFSDREFTIRIIDGILNNNQVPQWITSPGALTVGTEGIQYFFQLQANDSDSSPQPLRYTLVGGSLPSGLALNQNSGIISGFPNAADDFTFIIRISDGLAFIDRTFSIKIEEEIVVNNPPIWITGGV